MELYSRRRSYLGSKNPNYKGGKEVPCKQCGELVYCAPSRVKRAKNIFCLPQCHDGFRRKPKQPKRSMIGSDHPRWAGSRYCKICGIELFERYQRRTGNCRSKNCLQTSRKNGNRITAIKRSKQPCWIFCRQCGKEIKRRNKYKAIFCSRTCTGKWASENKSGSNSYAWKGPEKRKNETYSPEWTPQLRTQIRRRDDFNCQACSRFQRALDVHHIDGDKWNCDPGNLISLCRSCHRFIESGSKVCPQPLPM